MDLNTIEKYLRLGHLDEVQNWQEGWTWLAGGTWLFTEPQPEINTLVDITRLGWSELEAIPEGLTIGATCTMSQLLSGNYPEDWTSVKALHAAVHELASFKVQNVATIGGNLCLAIPAGTFAPVMVLLGATYEIVPLQGAPYQIPAAAFQTGVRKTALKPGELLRKIWIPQENLRWQVSYQRICVATAGLAVSIVTAAYDPPTHRVRFAIGAAISAPSLLEFDQVPTASELAEALDEHLPINRFLDDGLASAAYRQQVTRVLLERSLQEATNASTSDNA